MKLLPGHKFVVKSYRLTPEEGPVKIGTHYGEVTTGYRSRYRHDKYEGTVYSTTIPWCRDLKDDMSQFMVVRLRSSCHFSCSVDIIIPWGKEDEAELLIKQWAKDLLRKWQMDSLDIMMKCAYRQAELSQDDKSMSIT